MFRDLATRVDTNPSHDPVQCPNEITWFANLLHGLRSTILHPLVPLLNFGFNYSCLFSPFSHCCRDPTQSRSIATSRGSASVATSQTEVSGYMKKLADSLDILGLGRSSTGTTYDKNLSISNNNAGTNKFISKALVLFSRYKYLNIAQLVVLTAFLSYHLAKDVREIIGYIRARTSK